MNNYQVNRAKWRQLTIFEQMGNIYSEVGRALAAHRRDDSEGFLAAFSRGLDLFDATAAAWTAKHDMARVHEILRAREQFARVILTGEDDPKLEQYFSQFAVAARLRQFA
jgi:hypothetical protein